MIYFTADWHVFHKNIIRYSKRPFKSLEEMADVLIENTNKKVPVNQTLYILGDFSYGSFDETKELFKRIKCKNVILVKGNHDRMKPVDYQKIGFKHVFDYAEVKYEKKLYCLSHYPYLTWRNAHRGSRMLCGHSHSSLNHLHDQTTRLDVGVDCFNFTPVSINEIEEIMKDRVYSKIDHHGENPDD